jgi:hypothetical protein
MKQVEFLIQFVGASWRYFLLDQSNKENKKKLA